MSLPRLTREASNAQRASARAVVTAAHCDPYCAENMLPKSAAGKAAIDEDFARDVQEAVAAHQEPLNPPAWD